MMEAVAGAGSLIANYARIAPVWFTRALSLFFVQGLIILVLYGVLGLKTHPDTFPAGLQLDPLHAVVHLIWGAAAVFIGFYKPRYALVYACAFALFYTLLAVLGTFTTHHMGMRLGITENVLHWALSPIAILVSIFGIASRRSQLPEKYLHPFDFRGEFDTYAATYPLVFTRLLTFFALQGAILLICYSVLGFSTSPDTFPPILRLDPLHAAVHLVWGIAALIVGFMYPRRALPFTGLFAVFYIVMAILGTFTAHHFGMRLGNDENFFHWMVGPLAAIAFFCGLRHRTDSFQEV